MLRGCENQICTFLNIPYDFVLVDWACEKVRSASGTTTAQLCALVREKLRSSQVR